LGRESGTEILKFIQNYKNKIIFGELIDILAKNENVEITESTLLTITNLMCPKCLALLNKYGLLPKQHTFRFLPMTKQYKITLDDEILLGDCLSHHFKESRVHVRPSIVVDDDNDDNDNSNNGNSPQNVELFVDTVHEKVVKLKENIDEFEEVIKENTNIEKEFVQDREIGQSREIVEHQNKEKPLTKIITKIILTIHSVSHNIYEKLISTAKMVIDKLKK
jgi:hypothetical protein